MKSSELATFASRHTDNKNESRGRVARAFRDLVLQLERATVAVSPSQLKSVVDQFMPDFNDGEQHDAFEFLFQFFDVLHEDLRASKEDRSIISDLFQSNIIAHRRFKCGLLDPSDDQPSYLILPLPSSASAVTLARCVAEWTRVETADEANPLWCSRCCRLEAFQMQVHVNKLSEYAVIQFLRFKQGRFGTTKDTRPIEYPMEFDSKELLNPAQSTGKYSLIGVVCHIGGVHGGHYTCVVRRSVSSPWYEISDSCVSNGSETCWLCNNAYILFYEQQR
jgi:ubiquitin C-terminal hydrolase